ncbi:hypothetical protein Tco_1238790 [Tanacetum coccineum]
MVINSPCLTNKKELVILRQTETGKEFSNPLMAGSLPKTIISTVRGNEVTVVKASAGCVWRPKMTDLNNGSKDNSGSWISKRGNPQQALKYKRMFDSGCSRYKAFDVSRFNFLVASIDKRAYPRKFIQYFLNHMANLEFCDKHHMVAYLQKSEGSEWFSTDHVIFCKVLVTSHAPETSPSRITSSLSLSPQHTPVSTPSTLQPLNTQPIPDAEEAVPMPHESSLYSVHSLGHDEGSFSLSELTVLCTNLSNKVTSLEEELAQTKQTYGTALTKLIKEVKKLEQTVKSTQARWRFRIVVSDDEEGTSMIQEDIDIQEKISDDTEVVLEEEEPTKLVEDQGSGEKGEIEVSTVGAEHSTVIPEVSTAAENLVYIIRSAEKKKDKGKGIMTKPEPEKKTKKLLEQERLVHEEAVRFQEQLNEEETQRIARDAEIARQLHEEINNAGQERVVAKDDQARVIDWSDPAVLRYHAQLNRPYSVAEVRKNMVMYLKNQGGYKMNYFKGMKYEDIRPIFEKLWDQIQSFAPMDSEKEKGSEKKGRRKKSLARKRAGENQSKESIKTKKIEDDIDKEELKAYLDLVPKEEFAMEIEFLDGGSKNYKIFSEMLDDFDRQDVMDLHRLVEEREEVSTYSRNVIKDVKQKTRDHNLWDVIVNGDLEEEPAPTGETSAPPAPKTAKQLAAKRNQERVKSILLLAIPDEYLLKFHNVADAKSLWEAIKSSLDKAYDRFQKLISQLEVHGAPISKEDINQKFLRSLPPSWNQITLIMRNKPDIDEIDINDLYNNLRVYEDEMKRSLSSTSTSQNLAFLSSKNTSSTNEVSTGSGDFRHALSLHNQQPVLLQLEMRFSADDEEYMEELDLRWQVAMLTVKCYNYHRKWHFTRECRSERNQWKRSYGNNGRSNAPTNESSSQALVAQDGLGGYDWSNDFKVEPVNYALMAIFKLIKSSDEENTPANDSFSKVDGFHAVPLPITGNFLTPRADISFAGLDKYAIRKKIIKSKTTDLNTKTSKTVGKTNEANTQKPKTVYESVNSDKVIIKEWNSDDEDDVSEVQTVSPVKTNETQTVKTRVDKIGQTSQKQGIGFKKIKACFVCKSTDHLIKDCNFHDKQSQEPKLKTVVNTGPRGNPEIVLQEHVVVDSGYSSNMTGNKAYLSDYEDFNRGFVDFRNHKSKVRDFQQIDEDDLEELDLRWQVAISGRNQGKRPYGDNGRSNAPINESSSQALVAQDGLGGYDWSNDFEIEPVNYALMAISSSSSSSSSDNEVQKCSKQCLESFKTLQKNYDSEREKHNRARLEIQGYELALESLESKILVHEKNELAWGEKYEFQNYKLKCREIKINNLILELEKVVKERDELKLKIEKWEESSKNLDELCNTPKIRSQRKDEYAIRKKIIESKTTDLNTKTSETVGLETHMMEERFSEVQTVSPVKTNETQIVKTRVDKIGQTSQKQGIGFKKIKACFVCKRTGPYFDPNT